MISVTKWTKDISSFFQVAWEAKKKIPRKCLPTTEGRVKKKEKKKWTIQREKEHCKSVAEP